MNNSKLICLVFTIISFLLLMVYYYKNTTSHPSKLIVEKPKPNIRRPPIPRDKRPGVPFHKVGYQPLTPSPGFDFSTLDFEKKTLFTNEFYNSFISIDKPIYRPGEDLLFKCVFLQPVTRKTLEDSIKNVEFSILDSNQLAKVTFKVEKDSFSLVDGKWKIPENFKGGDYSIVLTDKIEK
jgi:hypothetical protein